MNQPGPIESSRRGRFQFSLRTLFIIVTLSALLLSIAVCTVRFVKDLVGIPRYVETLKLSDNRTIVVYAAWTERGAIYSYEIREDGNLIQQPTEFCYWKDRSLSGLDLITADSGNMIAIVHSNAVLAIMDLRSKETWVSMDYPDYSTGRRLLSQLRKEVPELASLVLD